FFQAEDGIRDFRVTGVQTCALPICSGSHKNISKMSTPQIDKETMMKGFRKVALAMPLMFVGPIIINSSFKNQTHPYYYYVLAAEIGRASCRERVSLRGVRRSG